MIRTEWQAYVEALPPDGWVGPDPSDDEMADMLADVAELLVERAAVPAGDHRGWSVTFSVGDSADPGHLAALAVDSVRAVAAKAGLPDWPVARLELVRQDVAEAELARPQLPDLVGTQEVTRMLGVSRQRLHELRSADRFPRPVMRIAAGPLWLKTTIDAHLETWNRRPGRHANDARTRPSGSKV
jgi:predicted DNA-binding transcriptional regulator AlpA